MHMEKKEKRDPSFQKSQSPLHSTSPLYYPLPSSLVQYAAKVQLVSNNNFGAFTDKSKCLLSKGNYTAQSPNLSSALQFHLVLTCGAHCVYAFH